MIFVCKTLVKKKRKLFSINFISIFFSFNMWFCNALYAGIFSTILLVLNLLVSNTYHLNGLEHIKVKKQINVFKDYIMTASIMEDNIRKLRNIEKITKYVYLFLYKDYEMNLLDSLLIRSITNGTTVAFTVLYNVFEMMWRLLSRKNCCRLIHCC